MALVALAGVNSVDWGSGRLRSRAPHLPPPPPMQYEDWEYPTVGEEAPAASNKRKRAKRKRVQQACLRCRARKQRCSGTHPCVSCNEAEEDCRFANPDHVPSHSPSETGDPNPRPTRMARHAHSPTSPGPDPRLAFVCGVFGINPSERSAELALNAPDMQLLNSYLHTTNSVQPIVDEGLLPEILEGLPRCPPDAAATVYAMLAWATAMSGQTTYSRTYFRAAQRRLALSPELVTNWTVTASTLLADYAESCLQDALLRNTLLSCIDIGDKKQDSVLTARSHFWRAYSQARGGADPINPASSASETAGAALGAAIYVMTAGGLARLPGTSTGLFGTSIRYGELANVSPRGTWPMPVMAFVHAAQAQQLCISQHTSTAVELATSAWTSTRHLFATKIFSPLLALLSYAICSVFARTGKQPEAIRELRQYLTSAARFAPAYVPLLNDVVHFPAQRFALNGYPPMHAAAWGAPIPVAAAAALGTNSGPGPHTSNGMSAIAGPAMHEVSPRSTPPFVGSAGIYPAGGPTMVPTTATPFHISAVPVSHGVTVYTSDAMTPSTSH